MGQILIRNLDDSVIDALKRRAADHATSTEEEARRALAASVGLGREAFLGRIDAVRGMIGPQSGLTIVEDLRADRGRDNDT
jgi:plasmid stability protein